MFAISYFQVNSSTIWRTANVVELKNHPSAKTQWLYQNAENVILFCFYTQNKNILIKLCH